MAGGWDCPQEIHFLCAYAFPDAFTDASPFGFVISTF